jgi:hypothetical protein
LLTQKTLFKKFITVLNTSSKADEPQFTGLTDLQEIINCVPMANAEILNDTMCRQIPSKLTDEQYDEIYRKLYLNPEANALQTFKQDYCIGEQLKTTDKVSTIIKNLNPKYILDKNAIKLETKTCLDNAGNDNAAKEQCKRTEQTKLNAAWQQIRYTLPQRPIQEATRARPARATNFQGIYSKGGGKFSNKKTNKRYIKNKNKTRKRKQKMIKKRFTRKSKHNSTKKHK